MSVIRFSFTLQERETCFSGRVDAHYKLRLLQGVLYELLIELKFKDFSYISFCFSYFYVRQTKLASSLVDVCRCWHGRLPVLVFVLAAAAAAAVVVGPRL